MFTQVGKLSPELFYIVSYLETLQLTSRWWNNQKERKRWLVKSVLSVYLVCVVCSCRRLWMCWTVRRWRNFTWEVTASTPLVNSSSTDTHRYASVQGPPSSGVRVGLSTGPSILRSKGGPQYRALHPRESGWASVQGPPSSGVRVGLSTGPSILGSQGGPQYRALHPQE